MKKFALGLLVWLSLASPALAHPGRTSSDGCHYCRTNCAKWGEVQDARHCHNAPAVTVAPARIYTPAPTRVATPTPTKKISPTPTKILTPSPTKTPTPTPTEDIIPSPTLTIEVSPTPTEAVSPTVLAVKTSQKSGFWGWLARLFGGR